MLGDLEGVKSDFDDVLDIIHSHSLYTNDVETIRNTRSKCAVVGSSLELLRSNFSSEIDAHDVVFRVGAYYDKAIFTLKEFDTTIEKEVLEPLCTGRSCFWGVLGKKMNYYYIETYDMIWVRRVMSPTWKSQGTTLITSIYNWRAAIELYRFLNEADADLKVLILTQEAIQDAYVQLSNVNPKGRSYSSKEILHTVIAASYLCDSTIVEEGDGVSNDKQPNPISVYGSFVPYVGIFGYTGTWLGDIDSSIPSSTDEWEVLKIMNNEGEITLKDLPFHDSLYDESLISTVLGRSNIPYPLKKKIQMPPQDTTIAPGGRIYQTCAVVGADPTIINLGDEIDLHDAVFRTNHHLPQFENVNKFGTKTTYLLSTPEGDSKLRSMGFDVKKDIPRTNITNEQLIPLFPHLNSYLYEPAVFPFQSNHGTSGVRWSSTTGFASFLLAYYRCKSIDVYGLSVGFPNIAIHNYMAELIAIKMLELQDNTSKEEPTVRLFLTPSISNQVYRWIIALHQQPNHSTNFMMGGL